MYIGGVPGGTRLADHQSGAAHSCSVLYHTDSLKAIAGDPDEVD